MRPRLSPLLLALLSCSADEPTPMGTDDTTDPASTAGPGTTDQAVDDTSATSGSSNPAPTTVDADDTGPIDTGGPVAGCLGPDEVPGSVGPAGFRIPTLDDERATYEAWGLHWDAQAEPNLPAQPRYTVVDPDIHGSTEGDDLWTHLAMHQRTGEPGYLDRATAWRRYFVEDYRQCVGTEGTTFCYDRDAFGADHLWGWGLLAWSEAMDDADALAAAEALGDELVILWAPDSPFGCLPTNGCVHYGLRQIGRHLLMATRLAEITEDDKWITLRDTILERLMAAPEWDETYGTYFLGEWGTDQYLGKGAWANGARLQSPFMLGVLGEAMDHAYRVTGRADLRERMVAMAAYVDEYGLDPTYDYTGSMFGIVDGAIWHNYAAEEPVIFWDPVYTTALVNVLARGWRYGCDAHYYDRARHFFLRGNRGIYGEPTQTAVPDDTIHHFVDTVFDTSTASVFLAYNKGELQYTHLLFDPQAARASR